MRRISRGHLVGARKRGACQRDRPDLLGQLVPGTIPRQQSLERHRPVVEASQEGTMQDTAENHPTLDTIPLRCGK